MSKEKETRELIPRARAWKMVGSASRGAFGVFARYHKVKPVKKGHHAFYTPEMVAELKATRVRWAKKKKPREKRGAKKGTRERVAPFADLEAEFVRCFNVCQVAAKRVIGKGYVLDPQQFIRELLMEGIEQRLRQVKA